MDDDKPVSGYGKRPMWQWLVIYLIIGVVVYGAIYYFAFAKKGGYNYNTGNPQPSQSANLQTNPTGAAPVGNNTVQISNYSFSPATLTIKAGDTVTWINHDTVDHSATANDMSFDTGLFGQGKSGKFTFTKAGTYPYRCSIHTNMQGTIIVQ